jgi:hypothetical protein
MILRYLTLLAATAMFSAQARAEPEGWQRYVVPGTGTRVDIPTTIFSNDAGSPTTGQGRRFLTSDGRANLTVQSIPNETRSSPAAYLAKLNPPSGIIYRRVTPRFFAVSSVRNGTIWYNRCNFESRLIHCVLMNYPAAEKRRWDNIVSRISLTLGSAG